MKKVGIILVNYNGTEDTIECIKSIEESSYKNYKIVVVDNKSLLENLSDLQTFVAQNDNVKLIKSENNLGFAGGNNIGIEFAIDTLNVDYVLLLNNDTLIEKNTIDELLKPFDEEQGCGIVGAKILYYPDIDRIWYAGGKINWKTFTSLHYGEGEIDNGKYDNLSKVDFITGCVMMIKRQVIDDVGYLPEEYFMYYEDMDYCIATSEKNYSLYYNPKAIVYHKVSASSGGEDSPFSIKYGTRNRIYFMKKYKNKVTKTCFLGAKMYFYITRLIKVIINIFTLKFQNNKAIFLGLTDNM